MKRFVGFLLLLLAFCSPVYAKEPIYGTPEGLEKAISQIRAWYNDPSEEEDILQIPGGEDGWEYDAEYCFHKGELFFAFLYIGREEQRFYYAEDQLIRYIDESGHIYDYPDLEGYELWGQRVLEEAYSHHGGRRKTEPESVESPDVAELAGRYENTEEGTCFLVSADLLLECLFVTRMSAGLPQEEFRMAWQDRGNEFLFVAGEGEEHTYQRLIFLPERDRLLFDDGAGQDPVPFTRNSAYTDTELELLARQHYQSLAEGYVPEYVAVEGEDEFGRTMVHFYEIIQETEEYSHTSTVDWYYIDRETLETEDFAGNLYQLNFLEAQD